MLLDRLQVHRQMRFEGGFHGRPNKLVDGCYSFWVGGVFPLLHKHLDTGATLYRTEYLQDYVLRCCQVGWTDVPSTRRECTPR
jgi:prenyltransferase beta subunit